MLYSLTLETCSLVLPWLEIIVMLMGVDDKKKVNSISKHWTSTHTRLKNNRTLYNECIYYAKLQANYLRCIELFHSRSRSYLRSQQCISDMILISFIILDFYSIKVSHENLFTYSLSCLFRYGHHPHSTKIVFACIKVARLQPCNNKNPVIYLPYHVKYDQDRLN